MTINVTEKEAGTFIIAPEGKLDYITAPDLDGVITETASRADRIILDMQGINYIASAGLRVLLNAEDLMCEKNGLVLTNVNEFVKEVLDMTGFSAALTIQSVTGDGSL